MTEVSFGAYTFPAPGPRVQYGFNPPSYQNAPGWVATCGWKGSLENPLPLTANFNSAMSTYATRSFWYYLNGMQSYWEGAHDQDPGGLDSVDLVFAFTHGQAAPRPAYVGDCSGYNDPADSTARATWSMYEYDTRARSDQMVLGNDGVGLSFFAVYSCETAKWDQHVWSRWNKIFKGGLRMAFGFFENGIWCAPYTCPQQYNHGARFATYLGQGHPAVNAWGYSFDDNDGLAFNPMVLTSGNSASDCNTRLSSITWYNFKEHPRRKNSNVTNLCGWYWTELD